MFRRVLIANRGEIAVRVARSCRRLGIAPIGLYSEVDVHALHRRYMEDDVCIGPAPPALSYLSADMIVKAATELECEAVHPGYGFLAENAAFVKRCEEEGLVLIGPPSGPMALSGDKIASRKAMAAAGVPVTKGVDRVVHTVDDAMSVAESLGYPVMFKATAGGGGIGMSRVDSAKDLPAAFEAARSVALANFGSPDLFLEKYVVHARHIEIQVFVDAKGRGVHLGERECSVQRRHQKLIEESPSPALTPELREEIGETAVRGLQSVGYRNAGTVEFLFAGGRFHFNEVNARLQVEHPVTEMVTGLDLVELQLRIAAGEPLPLDQVDVRLKGHAMECRINAEDPRANFAPGPGRVVEYREPRGPGVRVESGITAGSLVSEHYDPLVAKLIVHAQDREAATVRMEQALRRFKIEGVPTTIPFHRAMLRDEAFCRGDLWTTMIADRDVLTTLAGRPVAREEVEALAVALAGIPHVVELLAARQSLRRPLVAAWAARGRRELMGGRDAVPSRRQR